MEQYVFVNVSCYLASGLSSALLVVLRQEVEEVPKSLAYLPFPVAIWLAGTEWYPMLVLEEVV
jgi:hypothetical protein